MTASSSETAKDVGKTSEEEISTTKPFVPLLKRKKQLPSVQYLLAHGDPETAHLPKTWCEIIGYPFVLAMVFAVSLLLFHHAPKDMLPPRKKFTLPTMKRLPMFDKNRNAARAPHVNKEPEKPTEL